MGARTAPSFVNQDSGLALTVEGRGCHLWEAVKILVWFGSLCGSISLHIWRLHAAVYREDPGWRKLSPFKIPLQEVKSGHPINCNRPHELGVAKAMFSTSRMEKEKKERKWVDNIPCHVQTPQSFLEGTIKLTPPCFTLDPNYSQFCSNLGIPVSQTWAVLMTA